MFPSPWQLVPGALSAVLLCLQVSAGGALAERSQAAVVPSPADVLGFEPGDDYRLADFRQMREYFTRLDAASDRVQVSSAGTSTEGNEMLVAVISSEANLARLDRYRDIARRLALVRGVSDADARAMAHEGKAIVWIDNGLHSSEVATAQHAFVLAHRLATDESHEAREIRDNVILVLLPCINPDGMNMVVDWYRRHLGTPHQDSPMPWLYQKYVGHDNNRDAYMQTQRETQVVNRLLFFDWLPQVMYNQHQGTYPPRIFVPPFPDPVNPNIDPQVLRAVDLVGGAMQDRFEREGKDGVISRYLFSVWYNGSIRTATYFHNIVGILTETGHGSATPFTYDPAAFPRTLQNGVPSLTPSVTYPNPWKGGTLRLRDAMDYMLTGSLAVLEVAAKYRERFLYGIYQVGARQVAKGRTEPPVAYVIPTGQHDPPAAMTFLETLMRGAVEVHRAEAPFAAGGATYPAGTHVVLLSQPFRPFAKDLLEPQAYPDLRTYPGGPPLAPYDTAGWTLSFQMGVRTVAVREPFDTSTLVLLDEYPRAAGTLDGVSQVTNDARRSDHLRQGYGGPPKPLAKADAPHDGQMVSADVPGAGRQPRSAVVTRAGWGYAIDPSANMSFVAVNRWLRAGVRVERATQPFSAGPGGAVPAGAWIVRNTRNAARDVTSRVGELGLRAWTLPRAPRVDTVIARSPRIGLYRSWVANMDEGWTRWLFERYEIPFTTLSDRDVRAGALRERFDTIVLPHQSPSSILNGHPAHPRPPSRPGPTGPVPPEYQGGIGEKGLSALQAFVREGGTLVTLDDASDLVLERFGAPFDRIRNVTRGVERTDFYCPGSVLRLAVDTRHRLGWGLEAEPAAYFAESSAFESSEPAARPIARYAAADALLMSGWLLGGDRIAGRSAALEVPYGRGRVVLFAFRPQFRAQPHGTFKLLFNALY